MSRIIITTSNNLVFDNRVHKIALSLQKRGYEVWLTGRDYPSLPLPSGRAGRFFRFALPFHKGPLFYLLLNVRILFFLCLHPTQYIWSVDMDTLPACRIAGRLKRVPVIFDSHEYFSEVPELQGRPFKRWIWSCMERWFIPGADYRFTVSEGLVKLYRERLQCDFSLLRNMPLKRTGDTATPRQSNSRQIIYQGALNMGRGLESAIRSMALLPDYQLIIVGQGDIDRSLRSLVKDLALSQQVRFVGAVPFEELQKYNSQAMVGLCLLENRGLNYYHSLPNRIFDYPQLGIPVVASNFPDIRSIVEPFQTGLLVDDLMPETIAHAIREACENQTLRQQWQTTLPRAATRCTWEQEEKIITTVLCNT